MSRSVAILLLVWSVVLSNPALDARQGDSSNIIRIDGKKNPESVAEYRVWAFTFRIFADGVRVLPSGVAEHMSTAETDLIFAEADQLKKFQSDCANPRWNGE